MKTFLFEGLGAGLHAFSVELDDSSRQRMVSVQLRRWPVCSRGGVGAGAVSRAREAVVLLPNVCVRCENHFAVSTATRVDSVVIKYHNRGILLTKSKSESGALWLFVYRSKR